MSAPHPFCVLTGTDWAAPKNNFTAATSQQNCQFPNRLFAFVEQNRTQTTNCMLTPFSIFFSVIQKKSNTIFKIIPRHIHRLLEICSQLSGKVAMNTSVTVKKTLPGVKRKKKFRGRIIKCWHICFEAKYFQIFVSNILSNGKTEQSAISFWRTDILRQVRQLEHLNELASYWKFTLKSSSLLSAAVHSHPNPATSP